MSIIESYTTEERLAFYEKALQILSNGKFYTRHDIVGFEGGFYPTYLCGILANLVIKSGNDDFKCTVTDLFLELLEFKPEGVVYYQCWWPLNDSGLECRKDALRGCIEICKKILTIQ